MKQRISIRKNRSCSAILMPRITERKYFQSKHKGAQKCQPETLYISTDDSPPLTQGWLVIASAPPYGRPISELHDSLITCQPMKHTAGLLNSTCRAYRLTMNSKVNGSACFLIPQRLFDPEN